MKRVISVVVMAIMICSLSYSRGLFDGVWIAKKGTLAAASFEDWQLMQSLVEQKDTVAVAKMMDLKRAFYLKEGQKVRFVKMTDYEDWWYVRPEGELESYVTRRDAFDFEKPNNATT